jgi:hypothetical protein
MGAQISLLWNALSAAAPYTDRAPSRGTIWDVSRVWQHEYARPYFDTLSGSSGWTDDWLRASRLFFLGYVLRGTLWESGYIPSSSLEIPSEALQRIARWLQGQPPTTWRDIPDHVAEKNQHVRKQDVLSMLETYEYAIWQCANGIRRVNFREYSRRNPRGLVPIDEQPKKWRQ